MAIIHVPTCPGCDESTSFVCNVCGRECAGQDVADVLAAIRRANLDQLAIVAKELVEAVDNRFIDDRGNDVIYWDDLKKYVEKLKELLT